MLNLNSALAVLVSCQSLWHKYSQRKFKIQAMVKYKWPVIRMQNGINVEMVVNRAYAITDNLVKVMPWVTGSIGHLVLA